LSCCQKYWHEREEMITQTIDAYTLDQPEVQSRIISEIDTDGVFWAYAEVFENGEWVRDDAVVSYQRDEVVVRDIRFDTDALEYFANQGIVPKHKCPNCSGYIPNNDHIGAYSGAISRRDSTVEICSACGTREALEDFLKAKA
jgi:hypothetical protein